MTPRHDAETRWPWPASDCGDLLALGQLGSALHPSHAAAGGKRPDHQQAGDCPRVGPTAQPPAPALVRPESHTGRSQGA